MGYRPMCHDVRPTNCPTFRAGHQLQILAASFAMLLYVRLQARASFSKLDLPIHRLSVNPVAAQRRAHRMLTIAELSIPRGSLCDRGGNWERHQGQRDVPLGRDSTKGPGPLLYNAPHKPSQSLEPILTSVVSLLTVHSVRSCCAAHCPRANRRQSFDPPSLLRCSALSLCLSRSLRIGHPC